MKYLTGQLGFYKLDHSTKKWEKIVKPIGLSQNFVDCIQTGKNGDIWVGTRTNGLFHLNSKTYKWGQFTTKNGLATSSVLDIICNNDGNIWIATDKDISQFDGSTWTIMFSPVCSNIYAMVFQSSRQKTEVCGCKSKSISLVQKSIYIRINYVKKQR
jgi:ligand-binding sensor domain-containing protein